MATNSIILLLVLSISCQCSTRDVYIQPSEGEHCPGTCYNINTFGKMAENFSNSSGLAVHFLEGTHLLDLQELVVFTNLNNAVFEGDGRMEQGFHETVWQSTVVIKCTEHSSTGIAFVNSSIITFRYITITNCGAYMTTHSFKTSTPRTNAINASLGYLSASNSIVIDHVSVQNGSGSGLLVITEGVDLTITNSSFTQNVASGFHDVGSNVLIVYNDPLNCSDPQKNVYNVEIANTNISFGNYTSKYHIIGGGLGLLMYHGSYGVAIVIDSVIAYSNRGYRGNLYIFGKENEFPTYNLTINNSLSSNAQGPALVIYAANYSYLRQCHTFNHIMVNLTILIANSKFTSNKNYNRKRGLVVVLDFVGAKFTSTVVIESIEISHNIGAGLELRHATHDTKVFVTISNVIVNNNSLPSFTNNDDSISHKLFVVSAIAVTSLVLNNVSITNNYMTGLYVYRTEIVVNGTSVFYNNTGIDGGGLAMYGDSYFLLKEFSFLNFTNNRAKRGGAIFVANQLYQYPCFFQYIHEMFPKSAKVAFFNNKALAGTALFGGALDNCDLFGNNRLRLSYINMTLNYSAQTGPSVISSEPTDVCFCDDNNTISCSQTQLTMTAYPGEEINISVVTVGQLNGTASGILQIRSIGTIGSKSVLHNTSAMKCTNILFTPVYSIPVYSLNVYGQQTQKLLSISLSNCPLGFEISNKSKSCDCEELRQTTTTVTCDVATNTILRQGDIWIGNISDCVVVHTPCPFDYCNTAHVSFSLNDPDPQCALNRTGILCGRCRDGLSLALGSNNCIQCPQFSYLALIIPFAAAGFGLVAFLMVLNLTVSIGTINGLIFYASIVKISESTGIFFPNGSIPVLSQFIAWLNLDLGIETCFYHGMTAYAKVWLQFVFPLYIWFIIATIIVLCRYSTWLSNKIGGNVVQVLATLILLSFTKIFRTFAPALTWLYLSSKNRSSVVWYVDGNIPYFSPEHYLLLAAAVLFLLLAVPYTLALLFDVVIEKYLTRIGFFRRQWLNFKPFVDAYHGPYKDNCRFWTGLLLLVRIFFTLVSLYLSTFGILVFITTSTTVLLSLLVTFEGVYQQKYLNILECSSFLNLGLLSALAAVYQNNNYKEQVVTIISVSVALVTFIGVLLFHMFLRFRHNFIKCCNKNEESKRILEVEDNGAVEQLVEPTSSEVYMRRESLIY